MKILSGVEPKKVFDYFEEISAIPRGSGNTEKIRSYCERFAESRGLKYISDKAGNIVIFKPACGCESSEPVIIQGHLDMVCEKTAETEINFENDPIRLDTDGEYVFAKGTTLGGDDGIAVAMCLALLDSDDIRHPPLEIVFTEGEETGMFGATAFDASVLNGKRMINLDSEEEGVLWVSCAGGVRADIELNAVRESALGNGFEISVTGLHGGHSGAEIHKGYANANKVMGRVLDGLSEKCSFRIASICGGKMDNAITRDSHCVIVTDSENITETVEEISVGILAEIKNADPDAKISVIPVRNIETAFDNRSTEAAVALLRELPSGVIAMSREIDGLVETSLNLGILSSDENKINYSFSVRSGKNSEKEKLVERLKSIAEKYSCKASFYGEYPAWEYKENSPLRDKITAAYNELFGRDMTVAAIHAGLECGIFCGKINGLDCVSLGPDIFDIHTPSEKLSISSTERMWRCLLKVLETL